MLYLHYFQLLLLIIDILGHLHLLMLFFLILLMIVIDDNYPLLTNINKFNILINMSFHLLYTDLVLPK